MEKNKYVKRCLEKEVFNWLEDEQILVIKGPRQCGKTTLLSKIKNEYLKLGYLEENIFEIIFEDELEKEKFEKDPKNYINFLINKNQKCIFLIDEVQYIKNIGKILKLLYDTTSNIKFIVTGSSALDLNKMGEFLVGRGLFFTLNPFSFEEFLEAKNKKLLNIYNKYKISINNFNYLKNYNLKNVEIYIKELNIYLEEYLIYGGYPKVVLETNKEKKKILLKNIYNTYLEKDIIKVYGLNMKEKVMNLIKYLSVIMGQNIVYEDICNTININFNDLKNVLQVLEETFVIKQIKPFHKNLATELKKNPKIYFVDIGLRNILLNQFEFNDFGNLYEWYIFKLLKDKDLLYWRTKNKTEVDFILRKNFENIIPIEVKSKVKITRSFKSFISTYNPKYNLIANKIDLKILDEELKIYAIPLSLTNF